jgi:two-component system, OmpR family, alkaline phosphatase synthesis response regulator PhoP
MKKHLIKVLVVDDEPDIVEFLSYNFSKHGFNVLTAQNGKDGFTASCTHHPDIIVCDILMPEMNGIDMCKLLRAREEFRKTPFIFLSAVHDDYQVMHAMLAGADQYVGKPARFSYLLGLIKEYVPRHN